MKKDRQFVYFIAAGHADAVKIGFTTGNPWARVSALQTGCPTPLDLIAYVSASMDEEKEFHRAFAPLNIQGEWFSIAGKLSDFLWYLADYAKPNNREITRDQLGAAIWDCCIVGMCPSTMPEQEYNATVDLSVWQSLVDEHDAFLAEFDRKVANVH